MEVRSISLQASLGGDCETVATSVASAQNAAAFTVDDALVTPSATCFMRKGVNPTALSTGVDQTLLAGNSYRVNGLKGFKLAFILATGTGTVHIAPGA